MRDRQPLPPRAKDVLQALRPIRRTMDSELSREQAAMVLQVEGFAEDEIPYYLELLLNRGYLYEVDEDVFLTDPGVHHISESRRH